MTKVSYSTKVVVREGDCREMGATGRVNLQQRGKKTYIETPKKEIREIAKSGIYSVESLRSNTVI